MQNEDQTNFVSNRDRWTYDPAKLEKPYDFINPNERTFNGALVDKNGGCFE